MKRKSNKPRLKNVLIGALLLGAGLSVATYREVTRPTSVKLFNTAQNACKDVADEGKQLCTYLYIVSSCQSDDNGHWLDLKLCGIVSR